MEGDREYVRQAVADAREALRKYREEIDPIAEAVTRLAEQELGFIERDAKAFARGEIPMASVVYPARQLAMILDPWFDEAS